MNSPRKTVIVAVIALLAPALVFGVGEIREIFGGDSIEYDWKRDGPFFPYGSPELNRVFGVLGLTLVILVIALRFIGKRVDRNGK